MHTVAIRYLKDAVLLIVVEVMLVFVAFKLRPLLTHDSPAFPPSSVSEASLLLTNDPQRCRDHERVMSRSMTLILSLLLCRGM